MEPARIYVNLEGKYPKGSVKISEKDGMMQELRNAFKSLADTDGNPVIKAVYETSKLYHGPLKEKGPDLVCVANDGYDLKSTFKKDGVFGKGVFRGMHTQYDAHCILTNSIEIGQRLHIEYSRDCIGLFYQMSLLQNCLSSPNALIGDMVFQAFITRFP